MLTRDWLRGSTVAYVLSLAWTKLCRAKRNHCCAPGKGKKERADEKSWSRRGRLGDMYKLKRKLTGCMTKRENVTSELSETCKVTRNYSLTCWLHYKHLAAKAASERLAYCCYYLTVTCYYYLWRHSFVSAFRTVSPIKACERATVGNENCGNIKRHVVVGTCVHTC